MKRTLKTVWKFAVILLIAGIAVYFFKFKPVQTETAPVGKGDLAKTVFGTGTLEAKIRVSISPQNTGLPLFGNTKPIIFSGGVVS